MWPARLSCRRPLSGRLIWIKSRSLVQLESLSGWWGFRSEGRSRGLGPSSVGEMKQIFVNRLAILVIPAMVALFLIDAYSWTPFVPLRLVERPPLNVLVVDQSLASLQFYKNLQHILND